MKEETFSTFDAERILDVKYQRLYEWLDKDQFIPAIARAHGRGTRYRFSRLDLYLLGIFKILIERGLSGEQVAKTIKHINWGLKKKPASVPKLKYILFFPHIKGFVAYSVLINDKWLKDKSLYNLIVSESVGDRYLDHEFSILVNFEKIRTAIDEAIGG